MVSRKYFRSKNLIVLTILVVFIASIASVSVIPTNAMSSDAPLLLGIYPEGFINQTTINNELIALDNWTGKKTSIAGIYAEIDDPNVQFLTAQLDSLWTNGYVAFINLKTGYFSQPTASQIAAGNYDAAISNWAQTYALWAKNGKWAFIAPLPEMNVPWVSYSRDPNNYKLAFARIRQIFSQNNVPASAVRWVFAPNGWDQLPFDLYFPGNSQVDVVGFSAFNDGYCPHALHASWHPPADLFTFSIQHLRALAPSKPIFITRTGSSDYTSAGVENAAAKNQWLTDTYAYLSKILGVRAVLYYNYKLSSYDCDWAIYKTTGIQFAGYKTAVTDPAYAYQSPQVLGAANLALSFKRNYLPAVVNRPFNGRIPVMLGTYSQNWPGTQAVFNDEYHALDAWAGKQLSIAGTFVGIDSDPVANVEMVLNTMWDNGYIPFVNLSTYTPQFTAQYIAQGNADSYLRAIARSYKMVVGFGNRMAYIAPLEEMNTNGVPYGGDPANFKLAYRRFQQIFSQEGVPAESVRWVFAPNGNSSAGMPGFENFYPGDAYVDVVGFTAYNFGYCPGAPSSIQGWHTPQVAIGTYLQQIIALAPTKPVFIAQTGTSAYTSHGKDINAKNQWLSDAYNYLVTFPAVKAVIYYNRWNADCDWSFYQKNGEQYVGYKTGAANPAYGYISTPTIMNITFSVP